MHVYRGTIYPSVKRDTPVSYTHLDVYKRQVLLSAVCTKASDIDAIYISLLLFLFLHFFTNGVDPQIHLSRADQCSVECEDDANCLRPVS